MTGPIAGNGRNHAGLEDLRHEIDRIDSDIHALLKRRAEVVLRLGTLKRESGADGQAAFRPGREAAILRRIISAHDGALPPAALAGIWRAMISAYLRLQFPFSVKVFTGDAALLHWDLARTHFGAAPLAAEPDTQAIIRSIAEDPAILGVMPAPELDHWWTTIPLAGADRPRVVTGLPVLDGDAERAAFVIARVPPEPTGDDECWIVLESPLTADTIVAEARTAGLEVLLRCAYKAGDAASGRFFLLVAGRMPGDDELAALALATRGKAGVIGLFARPVQSA